MRIGDMRAAAILFALLLVSVPMFAAATITFSPPAPTSATPITATVLIAPFCSLASTSTTVNGSVVRSTFVPGACLSSVAPANACAATFGPLPPGTYTYEAYFPDSSTLYATATFTVTDAAIPALSGPIRALVMLALCATGFGILAWRSGIR